MKINVITDGPVYRQDKNLELYKKAVELGDNEWLELQDVTKKEYDRIRVYLSFKKSAVRSKYLYDMAFSKGIRFVVQAKMISTDNYTIWIRKATDETAT